MQRTPSTSVVLLRLARIACLWGVIALVQVSGAVPPLTWSSASVVAVPGISLLLLAAEDTPWASVLTAAVLLATSPALQASWISAQDLSGIDSLAFLKTVLILGGLLLLARLEAGFKDVQPREPAEPGA